MRDIKQQNILDVWDHNTPALHFCAVGDGRVRTEDVGAEVAAAALRERFSTQRRRRRSSTDRPPPAADGSSPAVGAVAGPLAESIALVLEDEAGAAAAAVELIQTASPLRDH